MTTTTMRSVCRPAIKHQLPVLDFLAPSLVGYRQRPRHASITTSAASPASEPDPASLKSESTAKRRRPLSKEQKDFLDSAVRTPPVQPVLLDLY